MDINYRREPNGLWLKASSFPELQPAGHHPSLNSQYPNHIVSSSALIILDGNIPELRRAYDTIPIPNGEVPVTRSYAVQFLNRHALVEQLDDLPLYWDYYFDDVIGAIPWMGLNPQFREFYEEIKGEFIRLAVHGDSWPDIPVDLKGKYTSYQPRQRPRPVTPQKKVLHFDRRTPGSSKICLASEPTVQGIGAVIQTSEGSFVGPALDSESNAMMELVHPPANSAVAFGGVNAAHREPEFHVHTEDVSQRTRRYAIAILDARTIAERAFRNVVGFSPPSVRQTYVPVTTMAR